MNMQGVSLIGWVHAIASAVALLAGGWNILATKGTGRHRFRGRLYVWSLIVANVLVFFIYRFDLDMTHGFKPGPGIFGAFHWLAVATLFFTLWGNYASSRQEKAFWAYSHPVAMVLSYYLLLGGLVNELFARVLVLRRLGGFGSPANGLSQTAVQIATVVLLVLFALKVRRYRRANRGPAPPGNRLRHDIVTPPPDPRVAP